MELAHGLLLNEDALKTIQDNKKDIFIYEWLRFLHKVLEASQKASAILFCLEYIYIFVKISLKQWFLTVGPWHCFQWATEHWFTIHVDFGRTVLNFRALSRLVCQKSFSKYKTDSK